MDNRVAELLETIKLHNKKYRLGCPLVSDSVYDKEVEMLRQLDPDNDWFKSPEPAIVKPSRKSKLPVPMKSLNKVKSMLDLMSWLSGAGVIDTDSVVIMPKLDGLSLLCDENTGKAWSRGGSENEGQDCTEHLSKTNTAHDTYFPYTYGEFVFSVKNWERFFGKKINPETGKPYKSPRNTAAGLLNRDEASVDLEHVTFYRYGTDMDTMGTFRLFSNFLMMLNAMYFQDTLHETITVSELTEDHLNALFKKWRKEYYIDGLVVYVNDIEKWKELGRKNDGNPNYAMAYKHPDFTDTFETIVEGVTWKISKAGALKPVVEIETVDTGDCEMNSPTGYNASWIEDMGIARGAKVLVTRSGGVIPKILETLRIASQAEIDKMWESLQVCPSCGEKTQWNESRVELCCTNPLCHDRRLAKIVFFYNICGMEDMGEETIAKMYKAGYTTIWSMLKISFAELLKIDGFGEGISNVVLANNERINKGVDLTTLMHASDMFPGIGKVKAEQIISTLPYFIVDSLYANQPVAIPEDRSTLSKTMRTFWDNIPLFQQFVTKNGLKILRPEEREINTDGKCAGMAVCFSGVRNKPMEEKIVSEGGSIASGVSKNTTHLVVKDTSANSSKIIRAKALHIPILTMDEFQFLIS